MVVHVEAPIAQRYRPLQKLGEGGMGEVWQVLDTVTGREQALKIIHDRAYRDEDGLTLFRQEFRWMHALRHPGFVEVYEYGVLDDRRPYFTMELVAGVSLATGEPFPPAFACAVIGHLSQALGFLHGRRLVHLDVKPDNCRLVVPAGDPRAVPLEQLSLKLLDFGFMQQLGVGSQHAMVGTPAYIAPEMVRGGIIDHRADLYSLGVLFYELLVGQRPFDAEDPLAVLMLHLDCPAPAPRERRPELPPELDEVVLRLLAKDPTERYESAEALLRDLQPWCPVRLSPTVRVKESYLYSSITVGRDTEARYLEARRQDAFRLPGQAVFVAAPAGIGKTRLVDEFRMERQLSDVAVGKGRCEQNTRTSLGALQQALAPLIAHAASTDLGALQRAAPTLVKVLPLVSTFCPDVGPAPVQQDVVQEQRDVLRELCQFIVTTSQTLPVVLILEDLHWADAATQAFLHTFTQAWLTRARTLLIGTYRTDEGEASNWFQLPREWLSENARVLRLHPFDAESLPSLLSAMLGRFDITAGVRDRLLEASGGNVFFLTEMLRWLIQENCLELQEGTWIFPRDPAAITLPDNLQAIIVRRLELLRTPAGRMLRLAAVLDRRCDVPFLLRLSDLAEEDLFSALDELVDNQFLNRTGSSYEFTHRLVQQTVFSRIPTEERWALHQKCATALEQRLLAGDTTVRPTELAFHFREVDDLPSCYRYTWSAAEACWNSYALEDAAVLYQQAEDLLGRRPELDTPEAREVIWERLALIGFYVRERMGLQYARRLVEANLQWGALGWVPRLAPWTGSVVAGAVGVLGSLLQGRLQDQPRTLPQVLERARKIYTYLTFESVLLAGLGDLSACVSHSRRLLPWVQTRVSVPYGGYLVSRSLALVRQGRYAQHQAEMAEAVVAFETDRKTPVAPHDRALALGGAGYADVALNLSFRGLPQVADFARQAHEVADRCGVPWVDLLQHGALLNYHAFRGDAVAAREHLAPLEDEARRQRPSMALASTVCIATAWLAIERGEGDEALARIESLARLDPENRYFNAWECILRSRLEDDPGEARKLLDTAHLQSRHAEVQSAQTLLKALCLEAEILLRRGDAAGARPYLIEAHKLCIAADTRCEFDQIVCLRLLGIYHRQQQQADEGWKRLEQSLQVAQTLGNPIQTACTQAAMARHLQASGEATAAQDRLASARREFAGLGNDHQIRLLAE